MGSQIHGHESLKPTFKNRSLTFYNPIEQCVMQLDTFVNLSFLIREVIGLRGQISQAMGSQIHGHESLEPIFKNHSLTFHNPINQYAMQLGKFVNLSFLIREVI